MQINRETMTAVELLVERLAENGILHSSDIAEAKEMEKKQLLISSNTSAKEAFMKFQMRLLLKNGYMKPLNQNKMRQIVYNSVKCLECNEVLVSRHRHDYVTCGCPNDAMVDGGNDYGRYGAMDMDKIETYYVYADDDYELVRKYATRGNRGVDGKQPLTWIPICDMDDEYLQAVLDYGGADWHLEIIRKEIAYRFKNTNK